MTSPANEVDSAHKVQALHWERGRPARNERAARTRVRDFELLSDRRTFRCSGGRDARAPSEELESYSVSSAAVAGPVSLKQIPLSGSM